MGIVANRRDIPYGRDNAISRAALRKVWNCTGREAREIIAFLRRFPGGDGCAILSSSSTTPAGYWRSDDPEEIQAFVQETENRARNTFLSLRDARRVLQKLNAAGQMTIDDLAAGGGADGR